MYPLVTIDTSRICLSADKTIEQITCSENRFGKCLLQSKSKHITASVAAKCETYLILMVIFNCHNNVPGERV